MLAQRVQHMRGSNDVRLLPAYSYSFCVLTGFGVCRKEVIARKRLERAQDKDGASGFLFRQMPSVAGRGCKLCPV